MWVPVTRSWKLNERHYGALQGLNKAETAEKHGEDQVKSANIGSLNLLWRDDDAQGDAEIEAADDSEDWIKGKPVLESREKHFLTVKVP